MVPTAALNPRAPGFGSHGRPTFAVRLGTFRYDCLMRAAARRDGQLRLRIGLTFG